MDLRTLTGGYAVSPQITPEDIPAIAAAGYSTVICNRPDSEIPASIHASVLRKAVEAAGLRFVEIPLHQGQFAERDVDAQKQAINASSGPVLAYCASGRRSTVIWMLGGADTASVDDLLDTATRAGYSLEAFRPMLLEAAATR